MASPAAPSLSVFRHRDFSLFWASRFAGNVAVQAQSVTIGWQVYAVARQSTSVRQGAFLVGMVGLAQFIPLFALTLSAGATADRHDRRTIILACLAVEVVCSGLLAALAVHPSPSFLPIFAIAVVFGASRAFLSPATGAMGPMLVPREELPRSIAWNSLSWQSSSILGPAVGGLLCAVSPALSYGVCAGLSAVGALAMAFITSNTRPARSAASRLELIREGLVYFWRNKIVLGAVSLDLFAVLLGGATALLPVFARDVLHVGAEGFGILRTAPAIGAVAVGIWLGRNPIQRHAGLWMFAGVAVFGLATLGFALSKVMAISVVMLALLGGGDMFSVFVRQSLIQIVTPDPMRGRVSAVATLFVGASNELGEFETGVAARLMGPVASAIFGGVGALAVTGLWAWMFPALRKADNLSDPQRSEPK